MNLGGGEGRVPAAHYPNQPSTCSAIVPTKYRLIIILVCFLDTVFPSTDSGFFHSST